MKAERGIVIIAIGAAPVASLRRLLGSLKDNCPTIPVFVHEGEGQEGPAARQRARELKVTLLDWTPYTYTAYLDADTQVYQNISAGFDMLSDGWDVVITPSQAQGHENLWHLTDTERQYTQKQCGAQDVLVLQAGVWFVAKNNETIKLWKAWAKEWKRYKGPDQGALLRALHKNPVKVWVLSKLWNGGAVIGHHFGMVHE